MITTNRRKSGGGRIKEGLRGGSHMICVTRSKRGKLSYRTNLKLEKLCNGGYADFGSYGVLENNLEIEEMWASFQPSN